MDTALIQNSWRARGANEIHCAVKIDLKNARRKKRLEGQVSAREMTITKRQAIALQEQRLRCTDDRENADPAQIEKAMYAHRGR